jgi:hypothetical protein
MDVPILYQKIRESQGKVKSEIRINEIERTATNLSKTNIVKNFTQLMIDYKHYYNWFLANLFYSTEGKDEIFTFDKIKVEERDNNFSVKHDNLMEFARTKNPNKLNVFTFSITPSNYMFFLTAESRESFLRYLFELNDTTLFKQVARVIFATPEFTRFVHFTFDPIIVAQQLYQESAIKNGIKANIGKCPILVRKFLNSCRERRMKLEDIIIDCWINPMCQKCSKTIRLAVYRVIDFFETKMEKLPQIHNEIEKSLKLHAAAIADAICNEDESAFMTDIIPEKACQELDDEIRTISVFSELDYLVNEKSEQLKNIFGSDKTTTIFREKSSKLRLATSNVSFLNPQQTMVDKEDGSSNLRHLLKYADNLPVAPLVLKDSIMDIIYDLCVKRGSLATYPQRKADFDFLNNNNINISSIVDKVFVDRAEARIALTNLSKTEAAIAAQNVDINRSKAVLKLTAEFFIKPKSFPMESISQLKHYDDVKESNKKYKAYDDMHNALMQGMLDTIREERYDKKLEEFFNPTYKKAIQLSENPLKTFILMCNSISHSKGLFPKIIDSDVKAQYAMMFLDENSNNTISRLAFVFNTILDQERQIKEEFNCIHQICERCTIKPAKEIFSTMGVIVFFPESFIRDTNHPLSDLNVN